MLIPSGWHKMKVGIFALALGFNVFFASSALAVDLAQSPLFLSQPATPVVMLSMSVDHELFKKAYNDYSSLSGGFLTEDDTTYRNDFTYYGYFDPDWCYTYTSQSPVSDSYFAPHSQTTNHNCSATGGASTAGAWSGNFLNWATMTRVDILRQVLFGGKRSVDTASNTVLERAFLPKDVHSFVKVYSGSDVANYTPYTTNISMCNVSTGNGGHPVIRVGPGTYRQWSANEVQQCQWGNGGPSSASGDELVAKVEVCSASKDGPTNERCKQYGNSPATFKPVGILQVHGEKGQIKFGLVTGSYKANLKGGVLRKKAGLIGNNSNAALDEVNVTTGQFNNVDGIIKSISALKIAGYDFANSDYDDCSTDSIPISTVKSDTRANNRACTNWGNPLGEIYLETLRYIAGAASPTSEFDVDDSTSGYGGNFPGIPGLSTVSSWDDPMPSDAWCTNCSIIVLSTGTNSFDGDDLDSASALNGISGASAVDGYTNSVGSAEFGSFSGSYFAGGTGTDRHCTATTLSGLSDAVGICPELPALEGTYSIAGLAYYAHTEDIRGDRANTQTVKTYAVDLAESLPSFTIPVGAGEITFLPACEAKPGSGSWQGCSLTDVEVENITTDLSGNPIAGSYLFYWEDSLWGNDYDLDGAQRISFCIGSACADGTTSSGQIKIVNSVPYAFAGNDLRFTYTITGTAGNDGLVTPWSVRPGGTNYDALGNSSLIPGTVNTTLRTFTPGTTTATVLKKPTYYAAKFGGFVDLDGDGTPNNTAGDAREWDTINNLTGVEAPDGLPDNYFSVSNPAEMERSLSQVFAFINKGVASGSAAAANSTQMGTDTVLYQARFNSEDWSGELVAYNLNPTDGSLESEKWSTDDAGNTVNPSSRKVFSYNGSAGLNFEVGNWMSFSADQRTALVGADTDALGKDRVRWTRGYNVAGLRERTRWLGDIVNSDPVFAGRRDYRFAKLPAALGGDTYMDYINGTGSYTSAKEDRREVLYVSGNDGMLHAFDAETGSELFTYVPSMVFEDLRSISALNYGTAANPHRYVVDGPLFVGDAFVNGQWRNILVGTLGAGGRGVFVLDVTNPDAVTASNLVLFELTTSDYPELGSVLGQPLIAPVGDRWKLVFGNGYNSNNEYAHLFVIDLQYPTDGSYSKVINTNNSSTSKGLAAPSLALDGSGVVTSAYAGDLNGNMWKFDLSGTAISNWNMAYKLYTARDDSGNVQPISSAPVLGLNEQVNDSMMVYFGTGKYFENGDNSVGTATQSFYALADTGSTIGAADPTRTTSLHEKTIATEAGGKRTIDGERTTVSGDVVSAVDWSSKDGWFLDLAWPANTVTGERVISKPILVFDKLLFPTFIPSLQACDFGGKSWIMELVAVGDRYLTHSLLGDSGIENNAGVLKLAGMIYGHGTAFLPISDIQGVVSVPPVPLPPQTFSRQSWRQLR